MSDAAKIKVRVVNTEDQQAWDQYIERHTRATPYHRFAWVTSVENAYGHRNVSLIASEINQDNNKEQIVGVLPAVNMQIPFKGQTICCLPFCDVGYALADSPQITELLLAQLRVQTKQLSNIEYRDTYLKTNEDEQAGQKVRMLLTLPDSSESLMAGFKSKLRSQIRKAEKNGLNYILGNNQTLLDHFYQVFIYNMRKLGSPVHSKVWFQHLFEKYQNDMLISVVYTNKLPIGAGIVLLSNNTACIPWASTLAEYNKLAPNMLLYWSILQHLSDNGYVQFDFGRSSFGEGTFKFKQQWGAEPVALNWHLPGAAEIAIKSSESEGKGKIRHIVEMLWSHLPINLTTWLGPKVRKYISL